MGKRPLIGISGSHNVQDRQLFLRENYMQSVLDAGGLPVLLPQTGDETVADALLDKLDGLLLAGGGDVDPARYGEDRLPACGESDAQRDEFELLITRLALKQRMPIFGICRGIQLLAVAMGGTLWQDVKTQLGVKAEHHEQKPPYNSPEHSVCFVRDGLFTHILGAQEVMTNSMHHQAVKCAGENLVVEGHSDDGVVEAVRSVHSDAVFAVQYHPEYMADGDVYAARLFKHLVKKASEFSDKR